MIIFVGYSSKEETIWENNESVHTYLYSSASAARLRGDMPSHQVIQQPLENNVVSSNIHNDNLDFFKVI